MKKQCFVQATRSQERHGAVSTLQKFFKTLCSTSQQCTTWPSGQKLVKKEAGTQCSARYPPFNQSTQCHLVTRSEARKERDGGLELWVQSSIKVVKTASHGDQLQCHQVTWWTACEKIGRGSELSAEPSVQLVNAASHGDQPRSATWWPDGQLVRKEAGAWNYLQNPLFNRPDGQLVKK